MKSGSKIALLSNERHFEIWFPKKKTITFFWSKLSKLHKKDPILHVATTFSLKQGETRTSHGPIPHPLTNYDWKKKSTLAFVVWLMSISKQENTNQISFKWGYFNTPMTSLTFVRIDMWRIQIALKAALFARYVTCFVHRQIVKYNFLLPNLMKTKVVKSL